jgi:hypothetical protein
VPRPTRRTAESGASRIADDRTCPIGAGVAGREWRSGRAVNRASLEQRAISQDARGYPTPPRSEMWPENSATLKSSLRLSELACHAARLVTEIRADVAC